MNINNFLGIFTLQFGVIILGSAFMVNSQYVLFMFRYYQNVLFILNSEWTEKVIGFIRTRTCTFNFLGKHFLDSKRFCHSIRN